MPGSESLIGQRPFTAWQCIKLLLPGMAEIIDGKKIADGILGELKSKITKLKTAGTVPRLVVILVGENPASVNYVNAKKNRAEEIGLKLEIKHFSENISEAELVNFIQGLNAGSPLHGVIVQLPLPSRLEKQKILDAVSPELDVDCLTTTNRLKLARGEKIKFTPPAAAAILKILEFYRIDLSKANILIVGSGDLVGQPLAALLLNKKINFGLANRYTENLAELAQKADILISGVGQPGLIREEMVKEKAVIIDAGTTGQATSEVKGDVDLESVAKKASLISPVPGGVGPVTLAMLFKNVVDNALTGNLDQSRI